MIRHLALLLFFTLTGASYATTTIVEVIELKYLDAQAALPSLRAALSPAGKITGSSTGAMIIVNDYPRNILQLKKVLAVIDRKPETFVVTVKFIEESRVREMATRLGFRMRGGNVAIASTTPEGIQFGARLTAEKSEKSQTLRLLENREGTIFVGQSVPFTETGVTYGSGGLTTTRNTRYHDAGTSLIVSARKNSAGKIILAIAPESSVYNRSNNSLKVNRAKATLVLDDPGSAIIGGVEGGGARDFAAFPLKGSTQRSESHMTMILFIRTEE